MKPFLRTGVWILALLATATATATAAAAAAANSALHPLEDLKGWAEDFLEQRLHSSGNDAVTHAKAGALDPRLRLQRCAGALQGILPAGATVSARLTIGVRCDNPAWTLYVPMIVETELKVLVLRSAAARGSGLTAADVEVQQRIVPGVANSYLTDAGQLQGRHLKLAAAPGTPLSTELLATDILIRRGQRVTLVASVGGIEVRAQGEAIADASAAGRVRVLNLSSRRIVEGQAESADRVRVNL
ncbi:MAG: flagellar basal body P-ring formation chaperone FlgA [Steroidobacteraceae bacterium]